MDLPAIEFHPFDTITLNFDDLPIKLRRCRLGDLRFAKNLLEEFKVGLIALEDDHLTETRKVRDSIQGIMGIRNDDDEAPKLSEEERLELRKLYNELSGCNAKLNDAILDVVYDWFSPVIDRMGDASPPPKDDWPLDLALITVPTLVIEHWQTHPLGSGRASLNGAVPAPDRSPQSQPVPSSPPATP